MKLFDTSLANVWPATQSQVYGELGKTGRVRACWRCPPRARAAARSTPITKRVSTSCAAGSSTTEPDRSRRSETLLRVFFLGVLTPVESVTYLSVEAARAADEHAELERLDAQVDWGDDHLSVYGRLALEYGLRLTAMQEEWASWAREQVAELDLTPAAAAAKGGSPSGTGAGWCPLEPLGKGIVKWRGPRRIEQGDPPWVSASPRAAMSH